MVTGFYNSIGNIVLRLCPPLWWTTFFTSRSFGFSYERALKRMQAGFVFTTSDVLTVVGADGAACPSPGRPSELQRTQQIYDLATPLSQL